MRGGPPPVTVKKVSIKKGAKWKGGEKKKKKKKKKKKLNFLPDDSSLKAPLDASYESSYEEYPSESLP
jgi:hypothetical protein